MTTRLEILGEDGEWYEVPGVTSVRFGDVRLHREQTDAPPEDAYWRRHDALDALPFATTAAAEARHPRLIDQDGNPVRSAWQSPYGPPPRRR